jgi:hypothetical protein
VGVNWFDSLPDDVTDLNYTAILVAGEGAARMATGYRPAFNWLVEDGDGHKGPNLLRSLDRSVGTPTLG